jgi:N-acetylglutamate synthase-like GNAT family acetyltransferase
VKTQLIFRTATNKDINKIVDLVKRTLLEFDLIYNSSTSENDLVDIEDTYINKGGTFEVIENIDSSIVGTAGLVKINQATCKLRKMYVDNKYRGKGLGEQLLKVILLKATTLGFKEIILETVHSMTSAIHLYEKFG